MLAVKRAFILVAVVGAGAGLLVALLLFSQSITAAPGGLVQLSPSVTHSQAPEGNGQDVKLVGHYGGLAKALFVAGNIAYVGLGPELALVDLSTPSQPARIGYTVLPDLITDIYVAGDLVYATAGAGLYIVDVSNPLAPVVIGSYLTSGTAQSVVVAGDHAYVGQVRSTFPFGRISVLNVQTPTVPSFVSLTNVDGGVYSLVKTGSLLLAAADYAGLVVVNVIWPPQPTIIGDYETPGWARGVAVSGDYAYVVETNCAVACDGGFSVVNIAAPSSPVGTGFVGLPGSAWDVAVANNRAYVADWNGGFRVVNILTPTMPTLSDFYDTPGDPWAVAVDNNLAYVADAAGGLRILDVAAAPVEVGALETTAQVLDVAAQSTQAYVADWDGFTLLDVATPALPTELGTAGLPDKAQGIVISGTYAYIAASSRGLRIVDFNDPQLPVEVGFWDSPGFAYNVAVSGSYAYLADGVQGIHILAISLPTPQLIGSFNTPGMARDVAVSGRYLYVADQIGGLRVLDILNPALPVEIGFYVTPGQAYALEVVGNYAYIADRTEGLRVLNVTDPSTPTNVGQYDTDHWAYDVAVVGDWAFVAAAEDGLIVLNITNPAAMVLAASYDTASSARAVTSSNDIIYVADLEGGVYLLQESYSISGRIFDFYGGDWPNVLISSSDGSAATTNSDSSYTLDDLLPGTYTLTPTLPGYQFQPTSLVVEVDSSQTEQSFLIFPGPVSATVNSSVPALLSFVDTAGSLTKLSFPVGVVTATTTFILTPTLVSGPLPGQQWTRHAFDLQAYRQGQLLPNLQLARPVTVSITYTDSDIQLGINEDELILLTGNGWSGDAAATCTPPTLYARDLSANHVAVAICQAGPYALFQPGYLNYLAVIMRD